MVVADISFTHLHHLCYYSIIAHYMSNFTSVINRDLAEKFDLSHPMFHYHSKSLELADQSATCYFSLVISSNHGPVSYHSQDKRWFLLKIANFPFHPCIYCPWWGSSRWNFVTYSIIAKTKTESCPYKMVERVGQYVHLFWYNARVWLTDRHTDGFVITVSCSACIGMLTCDRNRIRRQKWV